jgi:hypothetical protein
MVIKNWPFSRLFLHCCGEKLAGVTFFSAMVIKTGLCHGCF